MHSHFTVFGSWLRLLDYMPSTVQRQQVYSRVEWVGFSNYLILSPCPLIQLGYMAPIQSPITDISVIYQCLLTLMKVSSNLGQHFTFATSDLAAAKPAMNVVWNDPKKFESVIINSGAFHMLFVLTQEPLIGMLTAGKYCYINSSTAHHYIVYSQVTVMFLS